MLVEFDIPDVTPPRIAMSRYWGNLFFGGRLSDNHQVNALANTYMRLVPAAIVEYGLASAALRRVFSDHSSIGFDSMHATMSHFESCVLDMHRAIRAFRRLRNHKARDALSRHLADQKPTFQSDRIETQIRNVRDAIHHLDEKIINGEIEPGQWIATVPNGPEIPHPTELAQTIKTFDRLTIGPHELTFANMATWLTEMSRVAARIAEYDPTPPTAPESAPTYGAERDGRVDGR